MKDKEDKKKEKLSDEEKGVSKKEYEKLREELEATKKDLEKALSDSASWKNEYYKAYADTQNLRKSLEEDARVANRYRAIGFLENLIPALNAFHLALDTPAPSKEAQNYQIGFTYIYNQLFQALEGEGVHEIAPKVGDKFDMACMHAVETIEDETKEEGTITKVLAKGYKLHDRLITAAMVQVVAKKKEEKQEPPKEEVPEA